MTPKRMTIQTQTMIVPNYDAESIIQDIGTANRVRNRTAKRRAGNDGSAFPSAPASRPDLQKGRNMADNPIVRLDNFTVCQAAKPQCLPGPANFIQSLAQAVAAAQAYARQSQRQMDELAKASNARSPAAGGSGMTWQDVQGELEALRLKGERYTSRQKLADKIGCKKFLVQKAIANGPVELQEWASKQRAASRLNVAPELTPAVLDSTPQGREPDPADILGGADVDAAMSYLLDQAGPDERAHINAMSPAEQRQLAETVYRDPDKEEQALRYRRAKRLRRD